MIARRPLVHRLTPAVLLLGGLLLAAGPSGAQSYLRADCARLVAPPRPGSQDVLTARWYRRFWTGDCGDLSRCLAGSPNWNEVVGRLVARSPSAQRGAVLARACQLGPLIGLEWTRPRNLRRIDSGDLRSFKSTLEGSRNVMSGLERVEAQARAKLGRSG